LYLLLVQAKLRQRRYLCGGSNNTNQHIITAPYKMTL